MKMIKISVLRPKSIGARQPERKSGILNNPRKPKFKSVIHFGPSRQHVFERYLIDPEAENEDGPRKSRKPTKELTRGAFRRRLSSLRGDTLDGFSISGELDLELSLDRRNSVEDLQRSLGRAGLRGLERVAEDEVEPLDKFRRCAEKIIWIQRFVGTGRDNVKPKDWKLMSWTLVYDDLGLSKRSYADLGLSFDPEEFKLKRQHHISAEAKDILCMNPKERSMEQLEIAQKSLEQAVEAFSEFPIKMQRSLVRTAWYEQFEAGRVIIRQGHTADNFYMIICGTAVVTILDRNQSGELYNYTANILEKGYCFGELALIHQAKRSATVTCRDEVELLALGREDFIDIFMKTERGREPEHITFLKNLYIIRDWPVEKIPHDNPKTCIFIYVRRDCVLCRDSNKSDWIYVIVTGSCRVLKNLNDTKATLNRLGHEVLSPKPSPRGRSPAVTDQTSVTPPDSLATPASPPELVIQSPPKQRRQGVVTLQPAHFERSRAIQDETNTIEKTETAKPEPSRPEHLKQLEQIYDSKHPRLSHTQHKRMLSAVFDERRILPPIKHEIPKEQTRINIQNIQDGERLERQVFIEVAKLGPGEVFGLEQVVMSGIKESTSCSLVSEGAECILINRKFFRKHLTEDLAKRIRTEIQPFPSEETLQRKLQTQTNWDAFRQMTVDDQLAYKKYVQNTLLNY